MAHRGVVEAFYRHYLTNDPPPAWVPVATEEKEKAMATNLIESSNVTVLTKIAKLEDELNAARELLEQRPPEPTGTGTVVRFKKFGQAYSFAAIHVREGAFTGKGIWYVTQDGSRSGKQGIPPKYWDDLLDWIGPRNFETIEVLA